MSKTNEEFMKQQLTGSIGGDEDFLYEQYILQEQMNDEYWQWKNEQSHSIFPDIVEYYESNYLPTPDEELENFKQIKENGHS